MQGLLNVSPQHKAAMLTRCIRTTLKGGTTRSAADGAEGMFLVGKRNRVRSGWRSSVETAGNWLRGVKSGSDDKTATRREPATNVPTGNRQVEGEPF
jgi:hypothetical protein